MPKFVRFLVTWAAVALLAAGALAADNKDKARAKPGRDPVQEAFNLPRGTALRPDQQSKFEQLKQTYEPRLRAAIDRVAKASDDTEKLKAAGEARNLRQEISSGIKEILASLPPVFADQDKERGKQDKGMRVRTRVKVRPAKRNT
jgi:hypothetical protein